MATKSKVNVSINLQPFDPVPSGPKQIKLITVAKMVAKRLGLKIGQHEYNAALKMFGCMIDIDLLWMNYERQRWPEPKHILKMILSWHPFTCSSLQCRYDAATNRYFVADGQQHGIAWIILFFGTLEKRTTSIPVEYWVSDDPETETRVVVNKNCHSLPMAKYFIHQQQVKMKDKKAVALETSVLKASCQTAYKKRSPGSITHLSNLFAARDSYSLSEITLVLEQIRLYWPTEVIDTDMMHGLLHIRDLMKADTNINQNIFEDIFSELCMSVSSHFSDLKQANKDIMDECKKQFPNSFKGVHKTYPLAAGMIDVYTKNSNRLVKNFVSKPVFDLKMP